MSDKQRFITLLADHPWFEIAALCASPRSAGKTYEEAVEGRWKLDIPCPDFVKKMVVYGTDNIEEYCKQIDFTFCAVDMKKDEILHFLRCRYEEGRDPCFGREDR